jgi:hypothetical protein
MSSSAVIRPEATASTSAFVVAFVPVGVGGGPGDGLVEDVGAAEVGGDGDPVAGACERTRQ